MKFEEKLQSLRKKSNLSQEALADKLGVSRQAVSKWESGTSYPEMDKLIMMSKIFKCSLDDLVNDDIKDKDVLEKDANILTGYLDSFINSIVKSVKMFCSMKMSSVIKCLLELFFLGLFLFIVTCLINAILSPIVQLYLSNGDTIIPFLAMVFYLAFMMIVIVIDFIIFFQFYKTRYLDYYNQIAYSINQSKEYEGDLPIENKRIKLNDNASKIIIRDPKAKPNNIVKILSDILASLGKAIITGICSFILLFIVFIIVALCISAYLMIYNKLFIGISLCILCVIIVSIYLFVILVRYILDKKNKIMPFILTLIVSICVFSVGWTFSFISLKDIEIIDNNYKTKDIKIDYQDDLIISSQEIEYKVVDSDDIIVTVKYIDGLTKYEYEVENNIHNINIIDLTDNTFKTIDLLIDNLKNNRFMDYSSIDYTVEIKANRENIDKLIKNTSKYRKVTDYEEYKNNIYIEYGRYLHSNIYCKLNKAGFYNCYDVNNLSDCDVQVYGNGIKVDTNSCYCEQGTKYDYSCYNKQN